MRIRPTSVRPTSVLPAALLAILLLLPVEIASAQEPVRESRSVPAFTAVDVALSGTVHLRQGEAHAVEVKAPPAVLDRIVTSVADNTLEISTEGSSGLSRILSGDTRTTDAVQVFVTAPRIRALTQAGSGQVVSASRLEASSLSLTVAGSGGVDVEMTAETLDMSIAGSGTGTVRGQAGTLTANIAGSGDIRGDALEADTADVRIAGSGDLYLRVADVLRARIFGSGDVRYRGQPTVETTVFGSGAVQPIE
jgi:hypothetical protein